MANMTTYLEEVILDAAFRNVGAVPAADTFYLAIFPDTKSTDELEAGTIAGSCFDDEITAYTEADRQAVQFDQDVPFQQAGKATIVSNADVEYTGMPAVTVGFVGICDNATHAVGNILYWAELTVHKTVAAGDELKFSAGDIKLDLD